MFDVHPLKDPYGLEEDEEGVGVVRHLVAHAAAAEQRRCAATTATTATTRAARRMMMTET